MRRFLNLAILIFLVVLSTHSGKAQGNRLPEYGPNDTLLVPGIYFEGEIIPFNTLEVVYVSNVPPEKLAQIIKEYNRLKNAVYATYHFAQKAGAVINDVNFHLTGVTSKKERKKYIKTREAELKKEFADPLSNLSVYQGKVLMKLIYRETGNDCYDIIKEYRGGFNARMYQTVAFLFGSNLKQEYDALNDPVDRQIEIFVKELTGSMYFPNTGASWK